MLWHSFILLLSELQEKIIPPLIPLTSLCVACHSSLKNKQKKAPQIKKTHNFGWVWDFDNSHKLLFWHQEKSLVARSERREHGSERCSCFEELSFMEMDGCGVFPQLLCTKGRSDTFLLSALEGPSLAFVLLSVASFCFLYLSDSILVPPGNQRLE